MSRDWNECYDILVSHAGADEKLREQFVAYLESQPLMGCHEFRFCGSLGFGGKLYHGTGLRAPSVSFYREDETSEREETVKATNAALRAWWEGAKP